MTVGSLCTPGPRLYMLMAENMKRVVVLAILFVPTLGSAQPQGYHLLGQGSMSCGLWTAARREHLATAPQQWVVGFLSGVGFSKGKEGFDPLDGVDGYAVWAWIDSYCQAHPLDPLSLGASTFAAIHHGK